MLSALTTAERRQLEPVIEKLLGALTIDRWDACQMPACPVDKAIPEPGLPIQAAAVAPQ